MREAPVRDVRKPREKLYHSGTVGADEPGASLDFVI